VDSSVKAITINGADWPNSDTPAAFSMADGFSHEMQRCPLPAPRQLGLRCAGIQVRPSRKMVDAENRSGAYSKYVSTGSAGISHLQAGIT
jgi:hypothetical protein